MKTEYITEEQRKEYAESIEGAAMRLSNLISNILKLNKLENQRITPEVEAYDVSRQLCECILHFEKAWDEKEIELETEIDDVVMVKADESLLELVWNNLLSNAIKFTEPGGTVTVRQTCEEGYIKISVSDTGCGMDSDVMNHTFDKFYQGDTTHSKEGNGLGLALVKRVLELLDGYENFGWELDGNITEDFGENKNPVKQNNVILRLKRNRKIINKMELTRLQRNFESCVRDIDTLEKSKTSAATIYALIIAVVGTAFMAGATFAVTAQTPNVILCILLAILGFVGWILPYFVYKKVQGKQIEKVTPLIEEKYDEIYEICEKGNRLLS